MILNPHKHGLCIITYRLLLYLEHVMIKKHMKLLICVVDAKLFKRVCCKIFKAKYVQNSNELGHIFACKIVKID